MLQAGRFSWVPAVTLSLAFAMPAVAQHKPGTAITELSEVDEDFAFQGEYAGQILINHGHYYSREQIGLQVVALGDGKFAAVQYAGGLPGAGWHGGEKIKLHGERKDAVLQLEGGPLPVSVSQGYAVFGNPRTATGGELRKVHRVSSTMGAQAPWGAEVLFDGSNTDHFKNGRMTEDGLLMEGPETKNTYGDLRLHLEFRLPYMPLARGQGRANSGVYLQRRYEVQILDSFGLEGAANEAAALYRQRKPDVNMCLPPLAWQTYDIHLTAARFDADGKKTKNARITVIHNGVAVHDDVEITGKTGAGRKEAPKPMPILLQNHGNPVRFRNIWIVQNPQSCPAAALCGSGCAAR